MLQGGLALLLNFSLGIELISISTPLLTPEVVLMRLNTYRENETDKGPQGITLK